MDTDRSHKLQLQSIQCLRALAALLVLFHHLHVVVEVEYFKAKLLGWFQRGYAGWTCSS
ncbi:MAG: hypothetical protein R3C28_31020 [Pirellulaceae bacterium]